MGVSKNRGTPKSSILIRVFHYFHHPFWGTSIFGNTHMSLRPLDLLQSFAQCLIGQGNRETDLAACCYMGPGPEVGSKNHQLRVMRVLFRSNHNLLQQLKTKTGTTAVPKSAKYWHIEINWNQLKSDNKLLKIKVLRKLARKWGFADSMGFSVRIVRPKSLTGFLNPGAWNGILVPIYPCWTVLRRFFQSQKSHAKSNQVPMIQAVKTESNL